MVRLIVTDMKPLWQISPTKLKPSTPTEGRRFHIITVENHDFFRVPFFVFWGCGITRRCSLSNWYQDLSKSPVILDGGWVDDSRDCDFTLRYGRNGQAYGFLYQQAVDVLLKINMTSWDFHLVQVAKMPLIIVLFIDSMEQGCLFADDDRKQIL